MLAILSRGDCVWLIIAAVAIWYFGYAMGNNNGFNDGMNEGEKQGINKGRQQKLSANPDLEKVVKYLNKTPPDVFLARVTASSLINNP